MNIQIPTNVLMSFADKIDQGYRKFRNPYHNPNHAADVAQTTHFFICQTGNLKQSLPVMLLPVLRFVKLAK